MKKLSTLIAALALSTQTAFAMEPMPQVFDLEAGPVPMEELAPIAIPMEVEKARGEDILIGIIVGGIIGAIAADAFDQRNHRPNRDIVCFAQNRYGEVFRSFGRNARVVQNHAIDRCEYNTPSYGYGRHGRYGRPPQYGRSYCQPMGCRWAN